MKMIYHPVTTDSCVNRLDICLVIPSLKASFAQPLSKLFNMFAILLSHLPINNCFEMISLRLLKFYMGKIYDLPHAHQPYNATHLFVDQSCYFQLFGTIRLIYFAIVNWFTHVCGIQNVYFKFSMCEEVNVFYFCKTLIPAEQIKVLF